MKKGKGNTSFYAISEVLTQGQLGVRYMIWSILVDRYQNKKIAAKVNTTCREYAGFPPMIILLTI